MLAQAFFRNGLLAGTVIALAAGLIGYFIVLRAQVFAGDALSHVAFTGALAAAAAGLDPRLGLFAVTLVIALILAAVGEIARPDDVTIGVVFAWVLGLGAFFLAAVNAGAGGGSGLIGVRTLFGSIFDLSSGDVALAAAVGLAVVAGVATIARPLLFATVDPVVAAARGVPVRTLGVVLLVLLAATTAEATQAVGTLLLVGLLAAPAGTAQRLTARPYLALALSAALAVVSLWVGLALAYLIPDLPPSSAVVGVAGGLYGLSIGVASGRGTGRRRAALPAPRRGTQAP